MLFFLKYSEKNESLQRYISQIYLSNGKTVSHFFVSPQTSASAQYSDVHFNFTNCLTTIITQMRMKNRMEEPNSWAVIDTLDSEQEIDYQQSFVLLAAVALSCLESNG